jgi:hypothetical protein
LIGYTVAILALRFPPASHPCSCSEGTPQGSFKQSDLVFAGVVLDQTWHRDSTERGPGWIDYRFRVDHSWKGMPAETMVVRSGADGAACGAEFRVGTQYLVYAREWNGHLVTGLCSGNKPLHDAAWDLRVLGPAITFRGAKKPNIPSVSRLIRMLGSKSSNKRGAAAKALAHETAQRERVLRIFVSILRGTRHGDPRVAAEGLREMGILLRDSLRSAATDLEWVVHHGEADRRALAFPLLRIAESRGVFQKNVDEALSQDENADLLATAVDYAWGRDSVSLETRRARALRTMVLLRHPNEKVRSTSLMALEWHYPEFEDRIVGPVKELAARERDSPLGRMASWYLEKIEKRRKKSE